MVSYSAQRLLLSEFRYMTAPERSELLAKQSQSAEVEKISFIDPNPRLINYSASCMDQSKISQIHAEVETASGHKAEIILKLNLPSRPHIIIHANAENHAALEECARALRKIWPKSYADSADDRRGMKHSIIFDLPARYPSEADLKILNMQFVKMINENLPGFQAARISEICFSSVSEEQAENLRVIDSNP